MARAAARRRGQSSHSGTDSGCGRQGRGRGARGVSVQRGRSPLCTAKTFQRRAAMPSRDTLHASDCALSNRTTLRLKLRVCHRGSRKRSGCVSAGAAHGVLCARSVRRAVGAAGPPGCAPSVGACGSVRAARGTGRARRLSAPAERSVGTPDRRGDVSDSGGRGPHSRAFRPTCPLTLRLFSLRPRIPDPSTRLSSWANLKIQVHS